jgi:hypothetical protein
MKEDKEKTGLFDDLSFAKMTDEEFEQWAENHAKTYNSFVKSYKGQDPKLFVSETGNLAFELMPLIFIKMVFCNEEIREITKEEVLEKYSYLRDANLLSELEEHANKLIDNLSYLKNIEEEKNKEV